MKNIFKTFTFIGLSLCLSGIYAQTGSNKAVTQVNSQSFPAQNDGKSAYIANQDYLAANSMGAYRNTFGDSLKGFDENKAKTELLTIGIYGQEFQGHIYHLKRQYINKKYGIGPKQNPVNTGANNPANTTSGGKPIGGGGNTINLAPCVNEDFESTSPGTYTGSLSVTGWTIESRSNDGVCSPTGWNAGSNEFYIVSTPILNWGSVGATMGVIANSPLGGNNVAQLNDQSNNYYMTRMRQTFPVTQNNTLFQFAYAGYWQDGGSGHTCCPAGNSQPGFNVKMYDCVGAPLSCSSLSLNPGVGCQSSGVTFTSSTFFSWTNWQVKYIDLTPYIGTCVTIEVITADCAFGGHWGSTLFDARCGGQLIGNGLGGAGGSVAGPVSFCAGSNQAQIAAPVGYSSYQWISPFTGSISAALGGTNAILTIASPVANSVYTVVMVAPSGCIFTSTNALVFSNVNIAGIGSTSTCAGGASGSATVQGNGSGTGYNYLWQTATATPSTVGSASVATNLAPGIYSVTLTGLGSAGCGSAAAMVTITTGPAGIISLLKPFCNNEAYLGTTGGSNFKWYNGLTPITPSLGGTLPNYTVTSPVNGSIYWLSYLSSQGCQDSVKFTLVSSTPGLMSPGIPSWICPGGNNGTVTINMSPAGGAPPGLNVYSVFSTGTTTPYSSSLPASGATSFTTGGLSAGSYSVSTFDGSCKYGATFVVNPFVFTFSLNPTPSPSLCIGNSVAAGVTFTASPSLSQYTYSWSPTTFLAGNNGSFQNTIISPLTPIGTQTTIVYSVKVTPSVVNCPVTKTVAITVINPATPTINAIPNLCNSFAPYQIVVNPTGGTFSTSTSGTNNPIGSLTGIINTTLAAIGVNTFTYGILTYTCKATNTATYHVSTFNTAALSSSVPPLCVTSPVFNLMNIVQSSANGSWSGPGVTGGTQLNPSTFSATGSYQINYNTTSSPNPTTCPASTPLTVLITNTFVPAITQVPQFCTNSTPISMSVSPGGGGWINNQALSNAGVITANLAAVPSSLATYTLNVGPCLNTATTTLYASQYYPSGLTGTVANLCYNSSPVNLLSITQSTVGSWSSMSGQGVLTNSFFPAGLATNTYVLKYVTKSFPNTSLCPDSTFITVSVLNPPTPNITQVGPVCNSSAPFQLNVTPNTGNWTASSYLTSNGLFNPASTSVGNNPIQYVIGTSTCNVQQTKFINVEAFVSAAITSPLPDQCNTSPGVNLSPYTVSNLGIWSGPGISGTTFNPSNTGSGNFILIHNTSSSPSGLCPDQSTMAVNVYSLASPSVTKQGPLCNSMKPIQLQVSPVGGLFGGSSLGVISLYGQFNPAAALIGDNIVNYSITSGPCVAYAQTTVTVVKFVSAGFEKNPGPFCSTSEPVNLNSFVQNPGGKWYNALNGGLISDGMFNPSTAIIGSGNVVMYVTNSVPTTSLCPDTKTITIDVKATPKVVAISSPAGNCAPVIVSFNLQSTNEGDGVWIFGDGSEPVKGLFANHIYTTPGTYTIQYNYADGIGCKAPPAFPEAVVVRENPKADFSVPEEVFISDPQVQLTNLTTVLTNNIYNWKITNMSPRTEVNPSLTFSKIGKYNITLTATSAYGCKDELTKTIEVKNNFNIFIPNSFSPNFDGLNDVFIPKFTEYGLDTRSFEMEIFDRWGHSLFHTKDVTKGWDGSVQNKGEPLKEEVYIYRIKYKDLDGNAYSKMGHVSLVK